MRRFGRTLLSALLPELKTGAGALTKYLVNDVLRKSNDSDRTFGGINVNRLGRSFVKSADRIGKNLIESNIPTLLDSSSNHKDMKQVMIYDPFRAASVPLSKLDEIINDENTSDSEKKWAKRKKKNVKKKFVVQV